MYIFHLARNYILKESHTICACCSESNSKSFIVTYDIPISLRGFGIS